MLVTVLNLPQYLIAMLKCYDKLAVNKRSQEKLPSHDGYLLCKLLAFYCSLSAFRRRLPHFWNFRDFQICKTTKPVLNRFLNCGTDYVYGNRVGKIRETVN